MPFATIYHVEAVIFKTKLYTPINGDSNSADMQVECGDGNGPIKFMIQKAGSTDNTLGLNGWQSSDHWFAANLDTQSNIEIGELVWVRLEASIIKHLSFTNYRISAKRDGGKICAGVLSGGVIAERPNSAKKSVATVVASTALSGDLPDLPKAFAKTQINVIPVREVPIDTPVVIASNPEKAISLPDLPTPAQPPQESENKASVLGAPVKEKNKTSPFLYIAIGFGLLGIGIAGYFFTRDPSIPAKPSTPTQANPPAEVKSNLPDPVAPPSSTSPANSQPSKAPPSNAQRPSSPSPAVPDVNKIVRETLNK